MARILGAFLCATICACGDTGQVPGGDGGGADLSALADMTITGDRACADFAESICARLSECAPLLLNLVYGDVPTCLARQKLECAPRLSLTGSSATVAQLDDCAVALPATTCDDLFIGKPPPACVAMAGSLVDGLACGDDSQCTSGECLKPTFTACGVCGAPPKQGDPCVQGACGRGLTCAPGTKTCVGYGTGGQACDADHPCLPSLACKGTNKMGLCTTPLPVGSACDPAQGDFAGCDHQHAQYCSGFTNKCASVVWGQAGDTCGLVNGNLVMCAGGGVCRAGDAAFMGTCVPPAADGAACDAKNGPGCLSPASCIGGVCKIVDASTCK